jgi:ribosome recycling factor
VAVRGVRDDVMKSIEVALKSGDITEDDKHSQREQVQKSVDVTNRTLEAVFEKKEKEIT